jgi:hypothetical protein
LNEGYVMISIIIERGMVLASDGIGFEETQREWKKKVVGVSRTHLAGLFPLFLVCFQPQNSLDSRFADAVLFRQLGDAQPGRRGAR